MNAGHSLAHCRYHHLVNPGGFIVFDDYTDQEYNPEVLLAVNEMIMKGDINPSEYIIHGTYANVFKAQFPKQLLSTGQTPIDPHDFLTLVSNEFVLQKRLQ